MHPFSKIHIVYSYYQPAYDILAKLGKDKIQFSQGFSESIFDEYRPEFSAIAFDDLDSAYFSSEAAQKFALGGAHHSGHQTVLLLSQSLFHKEKYANTILKNVRVRKN